MIDIKSFKKSIEDKSIQVDFVIFKCSDNAFIANQYIHAISEILHKEIYFAENVGEIAKTPSFFGDEPSQYLTVLNTTELSLPSTFVPDAPCVVICSKIDKDTEANFGDKILTIPKLENWQIKDYVYSIADGIDTKKLDTLINLCGGDIYRLQNELIKIGLFDVNERRFIFDKFIEDGIFNDLSNHTIFDFTNAILTRNAEALTSLYKEIENIDCEPLGLVTTLYKSVRAIISIQFLQNSTPESTGLPANRFWAIKKNNCGFYSKEQLMSLFRVLLSIDSMLKSGEIDTSLIIDYVVCHAFSC